MAVLKTFCSTLQVMLGNIFSDSDVDLNYDPAQPTVSEVKNLDYIVTKKLCEDEFIKRAERMVEHGSPMAADCYEHLIARITGRWRARSHL